MTSFGDTDRENALRAIADMIERAEKAQAKFADGTSQHSLQVNRIHALRVAGVLVSREPATYTHTDLERAKAPLASLISKTEKAQCKLKEESWQHKMLRRNLEALYLARELLESACGESEGEKR